MPGSAPITGVDFAAIFVTDYPAAVEFYGSTLGLEQSADYGKIPGGEFETGNLNLQVLDAAAIGREFVPTPTPLPFTSRMSKRPARSSNLRAWSSSPRRSTAASAT